MSASKIWMVNVERAEPDYKRPSVDFETYLFSNKEAADAMAETLLQEEIAKANIDALENDRRPWTKEDFLDGTYDEYIYNSFGYMENSPFNVTIEEVGVYDKVPEPSKRVPVNFGHSDAESSDEE